MYKNINTHIFDCNHTISRFNFGGDAFKKTETSTLVGGFNPSEKG